MADIASLPLRVAMVAGILLGVVALPALAQERVGVSGAVNQNATGTPLGGAPRQLLIGQDVLFNERIATTEIGQTQLLFLDESSMTIGPNSDLTIDQFIYDPKRSTGKLAMSATRGLLRYVGGKLSKQDEAVTLRTSTATLAVRGGAFIARIDRNGRTEVIFIFGDGLTVTGLNGVSQTVRRPGFEITVAPGGSPSPPAPAPPAIMAELVQELDGRAGGTGGAAVIPTDAAVAQSGIGNTVSGDLTASVQQAGQSQGATTTSAALQLNPPSPLNSSSVPVPLVAPVAPSASATGSAPASTSTPPPVAVTYAGRLKNTNGNGTARGFVDESANGDVAYAGGTLSFPAGSPQNGVFTASVGNLGVVSFPLVPGSASFGPQGTSSNLGTFSGSSFLSADNSFFYANLTPTSQPTERLFIFGGTPVNSSVYAQTGGTRVLAFAVQPDAALQSTIPFVPSSAGGNLPNAAVSPFYIVAPPTAAIGDTSTNATTAGLQASLAINGQGANQQSVIAVTTGTIGTQANGLPVFNGVMRGASLVSAFGTPVALSSAVNTTIDGSGTSFYGGNAISGFVLNQAPSNATETPLSGTPTTYGFAQPALPVAVPSGVGANRTTQALTGTFGGLMYTSAQANPYIVTGSALVSTDATDNRVQATLSGTAQSPSAGVSAVTMQYGSLTGTPGAQSFVDNNNFAAAESQVNPQQIVINGTATQPAAQLYLVSSGAALPPTSLLPPGVSYCQCQYLEWGYWGGDLAIGGANPSRIDIGNINTWVAGVPTSVNDLNTLITQSATASYAGHAFGSVFNNGASYVAAGGFNGTYNFGTQTGTLAINNFDGHSFAASGSAPLSGPNYSISANVPGISGNISGTFYGPMAANTGGNFAFHTTVGPTYLASGIFAGSK